MEHSMVYLHIAYLLHLQETETSERKNLQQNLTNRKLKAITEVAKHILNGIIYPMRRDVQIFERRRLLLCTLCSNNVSYGRKNTLLRRFHSFIPILLPRPGGSVVSVSDSGPGDCEFDIRLRQLFFPAYFRLSPLQKHVRKVVGGFGKKSCVSTGVRKPGNTYASPTAMI